MSSRRGVSDESEWWVDARGYEKELDAKDRRKMARKKLYEVLKHYGYPEKKGFGKQWIKCPFHDDRRASAAVDWNSNYFTCFACEMKGTAVDLVSQREGLSLDDATRRVELL